MNLEDLKKEMPFKWRVQSVTEYGAKCVAYIDARDVQDRLDEVCGQYWQAVYKEYKGNLFCSIGIREHASNGDFFLNSEWIWRSDCGTESNVERQKGEASDAFKRAAVMWGIGRFLYSKKIINLDVVKNKKGKWVAAFQGKALYGDKISDACNYTLNN